MRCDNWRIRQWMSEISERHLGFVSETSRILAKRLLPEVTRVGRRVRKSRCDRLLRGIAEDLGFGHVSESKEGARRGLGEAEAGVAAQGVAGGPHSQHLFCCCRTFGLALSSGSGISRPARVAAGVAPLPRSGRIRDESCRLRSGSRICCSSSPQVDQVTNWIWRLEFPTV